MRKKNTEKVLSKHFTCTACTDLKYKENCQNVGFVELKIEYES